MRFLLGLFSLSFIAVNSFALPDSFTMRCTSEQKRARGMCPRTDSTVLLITLEKDVYGQYVGTFVRETSTSGCFPVSLEATGEVESENTEKVARDALPAAQGQQVPEELVLTLHEKNSTTQIIINETNMTAAEAPNEASVVAGAKDARSQFAPTPEMQCEILP